MSPEELKSYLKSEDPRLEWKQSSRDSNEILQAVCALANDLGDSRKPGFLLIGVRKDGSVLGIEARGTKLDDEQRILADRLRATRLWPTPAFDIDMVEFEGKFVFAVRVEPYAVPPIVTVDGIAWVRQGSTTRRATEADIQRLRERRPEKHHPFDLRPWHGATLTDLDTTTLNARYIDARESVEDTDLFPSLESWLTQVQLGASVQGTWVPNPTALLIFGLSPQTFLPGATVELVRYVGTDIDAPVAWRKTVTGSLPQQLETLWAQMSAHVVAVPGSVQGIRSPFVPEYPVDALKELVRNMIQHRQYEGTHAPGRIEWFDDRIEFSNPGGPFGRASAGEFGTQSDYRNPNITDWLVQLGYVEQLGRGIRLVRRFLAKNDNPELEVETNGFTRLIVRRKA
ncbi:MAG TPA: RNA-binding domain-containing protein [Archangium sp.]|uniref:RNA-binding domain-containing protein n=1 Tax=Archangium sp. TaxID=1872627 RepID=UPI002E30D55C|nr:RNA-binding domain-containing protein [Archangium sp.]HEX5747184.1 RNA-binding domain-containing protein [Archangium sp.]